MQQPSTQTLSTLFNGRIQFQVPVYQRAYVWNEEENWAVLWDDIADTARRYLENPKESSWQRHFLGPIVLSQLPSDVGDVDPRLVIDGQQRLTTLQVVLAAAAAVANPIDENIAEELRELVMNRGQAAKGDSRFKVWPSRRDRSEFKQTIERDPEEAQSTGISGAWWYFRNRIWEWIEEGEGSDADAQWRRLRGLQICLEELLYVVSINLDDKDNAQVIFETLNARGTGLGALDLVKNATFLQAEREGTVEAGRLNDEHWEPTFEIADDDYWLEEVRQGREKRARSDWFLMHWLALELGEVVRTDKLFDAFRRDILHPDRSPAMSQLVPRLCLDAAIMRSFDGFDPASPEGLFFLRLAAMDTTTMLPVALFLFREESLSDNRRRRALRALESWLVRRSVLRLTAKNYNRTLAGLINAMREAPAQADEAVVDHLRGSQALTAIWPSDEEVRARLEQADIYGYVKQPRVRMILEGCELDMRDSAKTEVMAIPADLTVEHAMPRRWEENWPLPATDDVEAAAENRELHVNRLGNLTLVTQPLNSSLSNAPWSGEGAGQYSKRAELSGRSVLLINQTLCQNEIWNEDLIDQRGADLTQRVLRVWPGPDASAWDQADQ